jgi:hypothetical protein
LTKNQSSGRKLMKRKRKDSITVTPTYLVKNISRFPDKVVQIASAGTPTPKKYKFRLSLQTEKDKFDTQPKEKKVLILSLCVCQNCELKIGQQK